MQADEYSARCAIKNLEAAIHRMRSTGDSAAAEAILGDLVARLQKIRQGFADERRGRAAQGKVADVEDSRRGKMIQESIARRQ